jgi:uncharacterized protein (TIGR00251 family)
VAGLSRASISVRVQPRSSRDEIAGERNGRIIVRVTAPPIEGRANAAVCRLIGNAVGVPKTAVTVTRGANSRDKTVVIAGISDEEARIALVP